MFAEICTITTERAELKIGLYPLGLCLEVRYN
jgi:hypothetical protein